MHKAKVIQDLVVPPDEEEKRHFDEEAGEEVPEVTQSQRDRRTKWCLFGSLGLLAIGLLGLIVGLSAGLTQRNKTTKDAEPPLPPFEVYPPPAPENIAEICSLDHIKTKSSGLQDCIFACGPAECCSDFSCPSGVQNCMGYAPCAVLMTPGVVPTTPPTALPRPVILDEDYGAFPDDIFALSMALEMPSIFDLRGVVATFTDPLGSAQCMAEHLHRAGRYEIPVFVGKSIVDHAPFRAGIWSAEFEKNVGLRVGFPIEEMCAANEHSNVVTGGVEGLADLILNSGRDDWVYMSVGGMTTIAALSQEYPEAAEKIQDMVVMGTNVCGNKEIYDRVWAPVQETNVACDPTAANYIFSKDGPGQRLIVMPVGPGQDTIDGERYQRIVRAAESGKCPSAKAVLDIYFEWSEVVEADPTYLTHGEALIYDPTISSALRYDPTCLLMAAQILTVDDETDDFVKLATFPGLYFDDDAYTFIPLSFNIPAPVSDVCPILTDTYHRYAEGTYPDRRPALVAIGYNSPEDHELFVDKMAEILSCGLNV